MQHFNEGILLVLQPLERPVNQFKAGIAAGVFGFGWFGCLHIFFTDVIHKIFPLMI
jgi:hypothetical protein